MRTRLNVNESGPAGAPAIVFAHGFGCDQTVWGSVAPAFADRYRTVLFDHVGMGGSDVSAYDPERYATLDGYADDAIRLCRELGAGPVVFVGHSVGATIGVLASIRAPELFSKLVLVCPSPSYLNDGDYRGGFSRGDLEELLETLDRNYLNWAGTMAPVIAGDPETGERLTRLFCRMDPAVAQAFARVTFFSDHRADLAKVHAPTLSLQTRDDALVPYGVGEFVRRQIAGSELVRLDAVGHCPHMSAPRQTIDAIREFL